PASTERGVRAALTAAGPRAPATEVSGETRGERGAPADAGAVGDSSDGNKPSTRAASAASEACGAGPIAAPTAPPAATNPATSTPQTRSEGRRRAVILALVRGDVGGIAGMVRLCRTGRVAQFFTKYLLSILFMRNMVRCRSHHVVEHRNGA